MKKLLYVTGSRAEYGIMKRLLEKLNADKQVALSIVATGMHCDEKYGCTWQQIEKDGFVLSKLIDIHLDNKNNAAIIESMAHCLREFGHYFSREKFDAVMLLGDRYEIYSVATAAAMHNVPIIHLHGGEQTLGNYDEFIRHCITKMSQLHLVSTEEYRKRVIQLGEEPARVHNIGALGAENSLSLDLPDKIALENKFGSLSKPYFMVVFHPETLSNITPLLQVQQLLGALNMLTEQYDFIFIGSNSDTGSDAIVEKIQQFSLTHGSRFMKSISPEEYLALNKYSQGLIGNSSSGLIEIPSLKVATINIGDRQKGRVRGSSVIDSVCEKLAILEAIQYSQSQSFQDLILQAPNPYQHDNSLKLAVDVIYQFISQERSYYKEFHDL